MKTWGRPADAEKRGKAVDRLEARLQKDFPAAKKHSAEGVALHKQGELDKAIAEYDQALKLYPRDAEMYYNRGLAYRKKENLNQAVLDYTQAIKLDPKYLAAYSNRGYAYYKAGDLERSFADFEKIVELDPGNADAKKSMEVITARLSGETVEKAK